MRVFMYWALEIVTRQATLSSTNFWAFVGKFELEKGITGT